ncbi:hypothetical protein DPMN_156317 [Dreissena polymorpha]|uniref:Uncharacterized protein n=1 Tax=Dreissena polymorpha TaxID=45954 RepID=A0A9D4JAR2_DREPO|nr:hypothetical protein DPMN_156317 [Dreissena polymorpha]
MGASLSTYLKRGYPDRISSYRYETEAGNKFVRKADGDHVYGSILYPMSCPHYGDRLGKIILITEDSEQYCDDERWLLAKLKRIIGNDEAIEQVWAYKEPLYGWLLPSILIYHMFVVFQTKYWWFSIEKHPKHILIQCSQDITKITGNNGKYRTMPVTLMKKDGSYKTVQEIIKWLYDNTKLINDYHYIHNNSQHFGFAVFNMLSKTATL